MSQSFFRICSPDVTSEDFKDEVMIIDLKTGNYHSLRGSAAQIWRHVAAGSSVEQCVQSLHRIYGVDQSVLQGDVLSFLLELEKAGLVAPRGDGSGAGSIPTEMEHEVAYSKPVINSYGDLQDLLLLDPIHEIAPEARLAASDKGGIIRGRQGPG